MPPPLPPAPRRPFPWLLSTIVLVVIVGPAWFMSTRLTPSEEATYKSMAHDLQEDVRKRKMFLVRYQEQKDAEKEGSPIQRQLANPEGAKINWA